MCQAVSVYMHVCVYLCIYFLFCLLDSEFGRQSPSEPARIVRALCTDSVTSMVSKSKFVVIFFFSETDTGQNSPYFIVYTVVQLSVSDILVNCKLYGAIEDILRLSQACPGI